MGMPDEPQPGDDGAAAVPPAPSSPLDMLRQTLVDDIESQAAGGRANPVRAPERVLEHIVGTSVKSYLHSGRRLPEDFWHSLLSEEGLKRALDLEAKIKDRGPHGFMPPD